MMPIINIDLDMRKTKQLRNGMNRVQWLTIKACNIGLTFPADARHAERLTGYIIQINESIQRFSYSKL